MGPAACEPQVVHACDKDHHCLVPISLAETGHIGTPTWPRWAGPLLQRLRHRSSDVRGGAKTGAIGMFAPLVPAAGG